MALLTQLTILNPQPARAQTPTVDDFNPGVNSVVYSLAVQADGKILVGGQFTTLGGQNRAKIGRLNPDGTLDIAFNPGANDWVRSLALQADGKILVGGDFIELGGQPRNRIARLNADGTLDTTFNPGASYTVRLLAVQADGKILVGGRFTTLGGQARYGIGRVHPDGTLDTGFNPEASSGVSCLTVQADGKILVGGYFTTLGGQPRNYIGRLHPDGTLDTTFNPGATSGGDYTEVYSLAVQADGKILVGGDFTTLDGQTCSFIGRLNAGGTLDETFNPGADNFVRSLVLQADGKILVGGLFNTLGGQTRNFIGRLNNTDPATQSLGYDGSTITWMRGGSSPEVWRTTFDLSSDGLLWTPLGEGTRLLGVPAGQAAGWQRANVVVPVDTMLRARGFVAGGYGNGSGWFVESVLTNTVPPVVRPVFALESVFGPLLRFKLTGETNASYAVQTALSLPPPGGWQPVTTLTLINGWGTFDWTNTGEPARFFRALRE